MLTLQDAWDAAAALEGRVHRTPLLSSRSLGERTGTRAWLKAENLQRTGSFKVRGALNRVRLLGEDERRRGLITVSAGNHAQAVAYAAAADGVHATVVMPESAPAAKVEASRGYGADVVLHGTLLDVFPKCEQLQREHGYTFVHPFADPAVVAGQGTVALEILSGLPDAEVIVVPVGGGGLISGIATAAKGLRPDVRIIGVEPTGAAALSAALDAGHVVPLERIDTIADGLSAPAASELTLEVAQRLVDDVVVVSDAELIEGMRFLLERARLLVEPAGAAAVAALLAGRVALAAKAKVVAVLSGGNVDLETVCQLLQGGGEGEGGGA